MDSRFAARCAAFVGILVCGASPVLAQDASAPRGPEAPIETDRPGNGNAATVVPRWRPQIETSMTYAFDAADTDDSHQVSFPTAFRLGVLPFLELRASTSILGVDFGADANVVNPTDTSVGTKVQALENQGWTPDLGVVIDVFLPSGRGAFTAGAVVPDARVAASWALPLRFRLLINAGADVPEDVEGRFARFVYVTNLTYALPVLERRLSFFVEAFGRIPRAGRDPVVQIDAGAAFLLGTNWQLDMFIQRAFTAESPSFQCSVGLSMRFGRRSAAGAKPTATTSDVNSFGLW